MKKKELLERIEIIEKYLIDKRLEEVQEYMEGVLKKTEEIYFNSSEHNTEPTRFNGFFNSLCKNKEREFKIGDIYAIKLKEYEKGKKYYLARCLDDNVFSCMESHEIFAYGEIEKISDRITFERI